MDFDDLVKEGIIKNLPEVEKQKYIQFHEKLFNEDYQLCKQLVNKYPRWSIIAGYYAMHDLAKLFLAKLFNLKVSGRNVHLAAIEALKRFKFELAEVLNKATSSIQVNDLIDMLNTGRIQRSTSQYYKTKLKRYNSNDAKDFLNNFVDPFIKAIKTIENV